MIGETIAHYKITGKLGEGAMGEVYRATDTRLKREVAIKLLSSRLAGDPELMARLRREAEVLASLNHTNIGQIYGLEPSGDSLALVLELVEGETLADRLQKGPLPSDRALKVAHQIAAALETAHEGGIIHRDLKPANVKRTPAGEVKVLDFGLAKGIRLHQEGTDLTRDGAVIGTPAYMSPEQVEGKPLDRRTDIWSFGCLLFEMLTGSKAFAGDSVGSLFAAIATQTANLDRIADTPPHPVRNLIERCLRKDPRMRLRDIGDARVELEEIMAGRPDPEPVEAPVRKRPTLVVAALLCGGVLGALAVGRSTPVTAAAAPAVAKYSIPLPSSPGTLHLDSPTGAAPPLAVSRDGRQVVFAAVDPSGVRQLYLRRAEDAFPRPLPGTEGAEAPFFDPEGKQVGFARAGGGRLRRISLGDLSIRDIYGTFVVRGASWNSDGTIIYGDTDLGLRRISEAGGDPEVLTEVAPDEHHHRWPQILPDGKHVLFTVLMRNRNVEPRILALETGDVVRIDLQGSFARYLRGGYLIYTKAEHLWAVRFDLAAKKKIGDPVRVVTGIHVPQLGNPHLAVTSAGVLIFEPKRPPSPGRSLVWVDRKGDTTLIDKDKGFEFPRLSPDGGALVFAYHTDTNSHDIWRINLNRDPLQPVRVTSDGNYVEPTWSPDSNSIVFTEFGERSLWTLEFKGGSTPKKLLSRFGWQYPCQWREGLILFEETVPGLGANLVEINPDDLASARTLWTSVDTDQGGAISPDGRWLAYVSDKSAQPEVYLRSYPDIGPAELVSNHGGTEPVWSRDGRELFYRKGRVMYVVKMEGGRIGTPKQLFSGPFVEGFHDRPNYDVTRDGTRFVMVDGGWGLTTGRLDVHLHLDQEIAEQLSK